MIRQSAGKLNNDFDALAERKRAEEQAAALRNIHGDFKSTLLRYIDDSGLTSATIAERAGLSERSITEYRREKNIEIHVSFLTAIALCIGLQLSPTSSEDLIKKAGYTWQATTRDIFLHDMLQRYSHKDINWWNEQLEAAGFKERLPGK